MLQPHRSHGIRGCNVFMRLLTSFYFNCFLRKMVPPTMSKLPNFIQIPQRILGIKRSHGHFIDPL
jgi:hypothetical protein